MLYFGLNPKYRNIDNRAIGKLRKHIAMNYIRVMLTPQWMPREWGLLMDLGLNIIFGFVTIRLHK